MKTSTIILIGAAAVAAVAFVLLRKPGAVQADPHPIAPPTPVVPPKPGDQNPPKPWPPGRQSVEKALADLISRGWVNIVTTLTNGLFVSYVPGLAGNSLLYLEPHSIVNITGSSSAPSGMHIATDSGVFSFGPNIVTPVFLGESVLVVTQR